MKTRTIRRPRSGNRSVSYRQRCSLQVILLVLVSLLGHDVAMASDSVQRAPAPHPIHEHAQLAASQFRNTPAHDVGMVSHHGDCGVGQDGVLTERWPTPLNPVVLASVPADLHIPDTTGPQCRVYGTWSLPYSDAKLRALWQVYLM